MAYTDWSTTANSNTTIDGTNIAEGCPPANVNNALRSIMAGVASLRDALPDTSTLMPKAAGTFSGTQPIYTGRGAYLHNNDSAAVSGRVFRLTTGSADPTGAVEGDLILFYTP